MRFHKGWTTHIPMLIKTIQCTSGPVLELGAGFFSTPLIHWLCAESRRKVVTCEEDEYYYLVARKFRSKTHSVVKISDWEKEIGRYADRLWSVIFIDHHQDYRVSSIKALKEHGIFFVLHDTNDPLYGYDQIYHLFKYRYDWTFSVNYVTVLSNHCDLAWMI